MEGSKILPKDGEEESEEEHLTRLPKPSSSHPIPDDILDVVFGGDLSTNNYIVDGVQLSNPASPSASPLPSPSASTIHSPRTPTSPRYPTLLPPSPTPPPKSPSPPPKLSSPPPKSPTLPPISPIHQPKSPTPQPKITYPFTQISNTST